MHDVIGSAGMLRGWIALLTYGLTLIHRHNDPDGWRGCDRRTADHLPLQPSVGKDIGSDGSSARVTEAGRRFAMRPGTLMRFFLVAAGAAILAGTFAAPQRRSIAMVVTIVAMGTE